VAYDFRTSIVYRKVSSRSLHVSSGRRSRGNRRERQKPSKSKPISPGRRSGGSCFTFRGCSTSGFYICGAWWLLLLWSNFGPMKRIVIIYCRTMLYVPVDITSSDSKNQMGGSILWTTCKRFGIFLFGECGL
jgi:hypothetical protein